jgi:hypothetical protein
MTITGSRLEREARQTLQDVRIVANDIATNLVGCRFFSSAGSRPFFRSTQRRLRSR